MQGYFISLERYVKLNVDYQALLAAADNGNYSKALTKLAIEFSKTTSPMKRWGVCRQTIIYDLEDLIEFFASLTNFRIQAKAYCYLNNSELRICFANSKADVQRRVSNVGYDYFSMAAPISTKNIHLVKEWQSDGVVTDKGDALKFTSSIRDTFVNLYGNVDVETEAKSND